jgi:hypothetical protein
MAVSSYGPHPIRRFLSFHGDFSGVSHDTFSRLPAHAHFSPPDTILVLPDPGSDMPYVQAMWRYARGIAAAAKGDFTGAEAEVNAIAAIGNRADFSALQAVGVPAADVLTLAREVLGGVDLRIRAGCFLIHRQRRAFRRAIRRGRSLGEPAGFPPVLL